MRETPRAATFSADERHLVVANARSRCAFEVESRNEVRPPKGAHDLRGPLDQDEAVVWTSHDRRSRYVLDEAKLERRVGKRSTELRWPKHLQVDPERALRVFAVTADGSRLIAAQGHGGMVTELFVVSREAPASGKARRRVKLGPIAQSERRGLAPRTNTRAPVAHERAKPEEAPTPAKPEPKSKTKPEPKAKTQPKPKPQPKLSKLARCTTNARALEARGDLWGAAIWAAGACAARGGAAATAELDRLASKLRDDGGPLDGALVEVFTLFEDRPLPFWRALARLQDRAPARKEEMAMYAVSTWTAEAGDNPKPALALLDLAAKRFERSATVWFCRASMRTRPAVECYRQLVACLAHPDRSPLDSAFERYAKHANGSKLSLRGWTAFRACRALHRAGELSEILTIVADATSDAARPTPTDRVLLLDERADALAKLGRPGEAADSLRAALDLHAREKLDVYFPRGLHLGKMAGLLNSAGRLDEAVAVFTELHREVAKDASDLWVKSSRVSGEPRFAVVLSGLSAPPARATIEAQLAQAKKLLRKDKTYEARDLTTPAVAGAFLRKDDALLAEALVVHSETLPTVHADAAVALPSLKRALALTKDSALRKTIERALRVTRG